jgi:hypothetical protein
MLPQILTVNPMAKQRRKYRSKGHAKHHYRAHHRASNPHHKHRRRPHHSNPLSLPKMGGIEHQLVPALIGGGGAIGVDIGLAYLSPYLPAFLQSGWGRILAQVGGAVGIGLVAGKIGGRETGKAAMAGALVITAYSALRQVLAPTLGTSIKGLSGLADFSDYTPTNWSGGYAVGANMGAYMQQGAYLGPARMGGRGMGAYLTSENMPPRIGMGAYAPGSFLTKQRMGAYMPQSGFGGYSSEDM